MRVQTKTTIKKCFAGILIVMMHDAQSFVRQHIKVATMNTKK
jgi:hypothetical protein